MKHLKRLRKRCRMLAYQVEELELFQRLTALQQQQPVPMGFTKQTLQPMLGDYQGVWCDDPCIDKGEPSMGFHVQKKGKKKNGEIPKKTNCH